MTDSIADMLTRIRNAQKAGKENLEVPFSKLKRAVAEILVKAGYLQKLEEVKGQPAKLILTLRYNGKEPAIRFIRRESKPGHRLYCKSSELPRILNGYGLAVISTPQGLMTDKEARERGMGGEVICSVY